MNAVANVFPKEDQDRHFIWDMLVNRDIAAFVARDWAAVEGHVIKEGFLGLNAGKSPKPDNWQLDFPTLDAYRDEWLRQAEVSAATRYAESLADGEQLAKLNRATAADAIISRCT